MKRLLLEAYIIWCSLMAVFVVMTLLPPTLFAQQGNNTTQYIKVSQIIPQSHATSGCNWVSGTRTGGLACYDDSSYIIAAAALGTAAQPVDIFFDVSIGIGSCILLPTSPWVTLEGMDIRSTGIFVLSGSNATAIANNYPGILTGCQGTPTSGTAPAQSGSVSIRHLGINGNRGTYPNGNSTVTDARCANFCTVVNVANLNYFDTESVWIYDMPYFGIMDTNIGNQTHHADAMASPSLGNNTDGLHVNGPNGVCVISDMYFSTGDDSMAFNAPEGYGGNITGCTISNITEVSSHAVLRIYTYAGGSQYTIGPVTVDGVYGTLALDASVQSNAFELGFTNGAGAVDSIQSLQISNAYLSGPFYWFLIYEDVGNISCTNCVWNPSNGNAEPMFVWAAASTTSNISLVNTSIYRNSTGHDASFLARLPSSGAFVKRWELNGVSVQNENGQSYSALPYLFDIQSGSGITTLVVDALDPTLAPTLLNGNQWSRITNFYGPGIAQYYRNTTYANLPPATYVGLSASISDSNTQTWGATVSGSSSSYAQVGSNGTNWTVVGK